MFDSKKAIQLLVYLIQYRGGMTEVNMALAIVWLSDRRHYRQYGISITGDHYIATEHGIFPATVYRMIRNSVFSPGIKAYYDQHLNMVQQDILKAMKHFDNKILSTGEIKCTREICEAVSKLAKEEITAIKNFFSEWANYQPFTDATKCKMHRIDDLDFLPDIDKHIKNSKLIEIFSNERNDVLNSDNLKSRI